MRNLLMLCSVMCFAIFCFAQNAGKTDNSKNPFFSEWKTPFGAPPFNEIKIEHFKPAFLQGMELEKKEVEAIINNTAAPTFGNTIEAMEKTGKFLDDVQNVFFALSSANTNEEMQKLASEMSPLFSKHSDDIYLNDILFKKVKTVYEQRNLLKLISEQDKLLEKTYKRFVRAGANLTKEEKDKLREINKELSSLSIKFGENVLKETNKYKIIIDNPKDLDGLPQRVIDDGAQTAKAQKQPDKWIYTTQKTSMIPFLQYSKKRELREKLYKYYFNRCNNNDEFDNKGIISKIMKLRMERASLLGYKTYADFVLEENMAKTPEKVNKFLMDLWIAALPKAKAEVKEMQKIIDKEGGKFKLASWDWWYYAEKVKKEKYDLDENERYCSGT
jgi:peptidyl-dipeptidase Dcp